MSTSITHDESDTFLKNTIDSLAQINTVDELNFLLSEFMSKDLIKKLFDNSIAFNTLPSFWFNAYKRFINENNQEIFPLKLLWLPILFNNLSWKLENTDELQTMHGEYITKMQYYLSLNNMLNMLFIEGLLGNFSSAYNNFDRMSSKLSNTDIKRHDLEKLKEKLRNLGW